MTIHVGWDNDSKTVVRYEFVGKWTWDEYYAAIHQAFELVEDIPYTVNMILDFQQGTLFPNNALTHFGSSSRTPPRDFDYAVIVSDSSFVRSLVAIFSKIYNKLGQKFIVVKTLDEARAILSRELSLNRLP